MRKSRDYLKKCLGFILLFGFISLGAIGGCNNNGGEQDDTRALTENDFAHDPGIFANPRGGIVVTFLEHPDSEETENDTGEVGNDVFPLIYTRTLEHTFCWEDDDGEAGHFMELDDSEGNEILSLDVNGECVTDVIEAGNYVMTIHHDGRIETTHSVFIIPNPENNQQARETDGLINRFKVVVSNIVKGIQNAVSKDARAQIPPALETRIKTGECIGCDLTDADLSFRDRDLENVDLTDATLTRAILIGTFLTGIDFSNATWIDGVCICQNNSIGQCVGCKFAIIPQKVLDLRPIRGMAYQPAPSDYSPGCGRGDFFPASCKYFDTDFANNDFKGLWSSNNPGVGATGSGRGDLEIMANELNINFLRLYNWAGGNLRNHIDFLNECSKLGIRVALPISNFTLECIQSQACGDFDPKQNIKDILTEVITNGVPHEAIAMWLFANEYDLSVFSADAVATAIQFLIEAEQELGVADENKLPISSPVSFGTFCDIDDPGIVKTRELIVALRNNPTTRPALVTRFVAALNTFNKANFMGTYLGMTFPEEFPNVALLLSEYSFNKPNTTEAQQATIVQGQLDLCESLISNPTSMTNPNNYFLGCTYFEWSNEDWKRGPEAGFGAVKFVGTQGNGRTVGIPQNGPEDYPIDKIMNKPVFDSIKGAFMK